MKTKNNKQKGYVMVMVIIFLTIFLTLSGVMISSAFKYSKTESHAIIQTKALEIAEAGVDKAFYELNQSSSYTGENNTAFGDGTFSISVTSLNSNTKSITVTGYIPNASNPVTYRTVKVSANIGQSVISFRYGVQAGNGGFSLSGGATINGSVYSNGDIIATNGSRITGSATAANPSDLTADQTNDSPSSISSCTSSTCITFGNSSASEDFAQSFKISSAVSLNNIQFYIKKVGSPGDATVRIVTDNSGSPSTNVLMTSTLSASAITTNFGWISVSMPSKPILDPLQTYWIVIDGGSNSNKYYIIGSNSGGYSNGLAKVGKYGSSWNNTSPSGLDGYFKIYLGGNTSIIGGGTYVGSVYIGTTASDNAAAHTVQGASVTGTIYCQTGSYNNKSCDTSRSDPDPQPMPISDANIQAWKDDAETGGTITGDYHVNYAGATIGPKVITGNLLVDGGGTLTMSGTLWVQGNVTVTGGGKIKLASSYGSNSGALVTDGYVILNGGATFAGSGQSGSYPFLITTSSCPVASGCSGNDAIYLSGGAGTVALIAQNGNARINGGSSLKEVTAKQITMDGGATLYYDSGLISENFSSGPGGSWEFVPGSYVIVH